MKPSHILFERELALLVPLQVLSSKGGEGGREGGREGDEPTARPDQSKHSR